MLKCIPDDEFDEFITFLVAENKAFMEAGIETGIVEFTCPICGGKAKGIRYEHSGRIHGMGSGCEKCGITHS